VDRAHARDNDGAVLARLFTLHDWIIFAYHGVLLFLVTVLPAVQGSAGAAWRLIASTATLAVAAVVARTADDKRRRFRRAAYRVVLTGTIVCSYLMLRDILPVVQGRPLDAVLQRADIFLFGVEPAVWAQRFATPAVVEYFAFFYFSYFAILALYAFAVLGLSTARGSTAEFTIGAALVYCIGQLGYAVVPGVGPVVHLGAAFDAPLEGGLFWGWVQATVGAAGALRDIFPSLHTAAPVWFTLFALRHARDHASRPWAAAAVLTGFFAINIVISTIVLRWHYAVDVIAGLVLAGFVHWAAPRLAAREAAYRSRACLEPVW
jgi:hypothetical protein